MIGKIECFLENYKKQLEKAGKDLYEQEMPKLTKELFCMFERNGNRLEYEKVYFRRRKFLSVFAILSILYEKENDILKLESIIKDICAETCWALPAHVNRKEDKNWKNTIDLFSSETAFYLAEIAGRLKHKLSDEIYSLIKKEVFERVLNPFLHSSVPYAWWETCTMNWCAVCNGSIGGAAIWLLDDKEELDKLLVRICEGLKHYIDGFTDDGACLEGMGYFTYGMSFYLGFADLLYRYSNGKVNLLQNKKFKNIALFQQKCFLPGGFSISFADGSRREKFRVGLTAYLACYYPEIEMPDFSASADLETDSCYRYLILSRDIFFADKYLKQLKATKKVMDIKGYKQTIQRPVVGQTVLPDAQWSVSISKNERVLAVKGGYNDEPHNHNDIGSFFYITDGKMLLADLGAGEYNKDYFGQNRYENLCCRSLGHNVPIIDGMEQYCGHEAAADRFVCDGNGTTIIGLEKVYHLTEEEKIERKIEFCMEDGSFIVTDEFNLKTKRTVIENFITLYIPQITKCGFKIQTENVLFEILPTSTENFKIIEQEYINHEGKTEKVWLIQWQVVSKKEQIHFRICKKCE